MGGRAQIEADNVPDLLDKKRVGGNLKGFVPMGFEPKGPPNAADGRRPHAQLLRHQARAPMGGGFGPGLERQLNDLLDLFITDLARGAGAGFIPKGIDSALTEPPPPIADSSAG